MGSDERRNPWNGDLPVDPVLGAGVNVEQDIDVISCSVDSAVAADDEQFEFPRLVDGCSIIEGAGAFCGRSPAQHNERP